MSSAVVWNRKDIDYLHNERRRDYNDEQLEFDDALIWIARNIAVAQKFYRELKKAQKKLKPFREAIRDITGVTFGTKMERFDEGFRSFSAVAQTLQYYIEEKQKSIDECNDLLQDLANIGASLLLLSHATDLEDLLPDF